MSNILKSLRPAYANINLDRLGSNIEIARKYSNSDIIAIVKAGGYGHGAEQVAHYAYKNCNVKNFGVATIAEGLALRTSFRDLSPRIIILGYVEKCFYLDAYANRLLVTVFNKDIATSLNDYAATNNIKVSVVLKLDTGMGRLGFSPELDFIEFKKNYPNLNVVHIMSHFASSDDDHEYSKYQRQRFDSFLSKYSDGSFDTSLFNSSAIVNYKNSYDLTRPGLLMYGYVSGADSSKLLPVMSIHSKLVNIIKLKKGQSVSYNRTFIADKDCLVGVVPIGYADGYPRALSNIAKMVVNNIECPVLGNICMDMTMIDVTTLGENALGAEVIVMGDVINASKLAKWANTIEYEIVCGITDRIPRVYESANKEDV